MFLKYKSSKNELLCSHIFIWQKSIAFETFEKQYLFPLIWTPIIGKIKEQEAPCKAVIRETIEETSLKVKENISFLGLEKYKSDNYWFFYSIHDDYLPNIELNHENEDFDFFDINNLPNNLWEFFKDKIRILSNH